MQLERLALPTVGVIGVLLGILALAGRPDFFGTVMGVLVLAMGSLSLCLCWLFSRSRGSGHSHEM
jgi:hypothetical protein